MTLLGNFDSMSGQEGNDPCLWNKRSERSMRDQNQCAHQRGSGARSTPHAAYTPPRVSFFFLFSCPYKISQQSHKSAPTVGCEQLFHTPICTTILDNLCQASSSSITADSDGVDVPGPCKYAGPMNMATRMPYTLPLGSGLSFRISSTSA